MQNINITQKLP